MEEQYESVQVQDSHSPGSGIALLLLNRPTRTNALDDTLFREIPAAVSKLDANPNVRVIIVAGNGKHFCAGIDLKAIASSLGPPSSEANPAIEREIFRRRIKWMQQAFTAFEQCSKPVIAAVHGACIGGGIDLIAACDLRYCTEDAKFSVKEVDLAITADLGSLQRLPWIVGWSTAMELGLTARTFDGKEAHRLKLVHGAFPSRDELDRQVYEIAADIAAKSPLAIMGTKAVLLKSRNCSVADGLDYTATWNAALLHTEDILETMRSKTSNRKPVFAKL